MTAKLFVSTQNVRALVSVQEIRATDFALQKPSIVVSESALRAIASYVAINPSLSFARVVSVINFANAVIADLRIEPDSLNRYLADTMSLADDGASLTVGKALVDSLLAVEDAVLAVEKGLTDTASITEALSVFAALSKSDSLAVSENASLALSTPRADSLLAS